MLKHISIALPLCLCLSTMGSASGLADPFTTESTLSLRPAALLASRVGELPCADQLPARPLTAVDVLDMAICNNPQTREVWANARAQAAQLGIAQAAWLPALSSTLSARRIKTDSRYDNQKNAALTLSWLAFDFGAREASINSARQLMLAAAASQQASIQSLFLAALHAYYTAQATQAAVISATQAEKAAQTSLQAAEVRYQVGAGTPADRLQAQTAYSQATLNRIRAEGEARNASGALANVMGFVPQQKMELAESAAQIPDAAFIDAIELLMQQAAERRPDLKAAELQLAAARAGVDLARAQGGPSVSLSAGPTWQENAGIGSNGGTLGVTVNIPIFTGFDNTYRIRAAEAQNDIRSAQRDRLKQQVALDVWKAYQSLTTATQTLRTTADLLASAEQSERVALGRYQAGVGNVIDVLTAQTALASARLQRIQATLDWNVYRATLAQAIGALDYSLLQTVAEGKQ